MDFSNYKIAVIGSSSMVGSRFCELTKFNLIKADLSGENPIDITDQKSVASFFDANNFDTAILFSAFTDVDAAQFQKGDRKGSCWNVNVNGAKLVQQASQSKKAKLIFISTETVFDGLAGPYKESDKTGDPEKLSWYGLTKKIAEEQVGADGNNLIIRICYPYRSNFARKSDFARSIIQKFDEGSIFPMFKDQIVTPTFIDDLTPAIELLISKNATGIYHVASPNTTTPFDFASYLLKTFGRDETQLKKGSIAEFIKGKSAAPRPIKGGLDVEKISKAGFVPTSWHDGINKIFDESKGQLI